jgi:tetratricopeptide (TPR) repeat protein
MTVESKQDIKPGSSGKGGAAEAQIAPGKTWLSVDKAMALAWQHHKAGRLAQSERICREVLKSQPKYTDALQLLGIIAYQTGHTEEAIRITERAIATNRTIASFHSNLCDMYRSQGSLDKAILAGKRALELKNDYPQALNNLGIAYFEQKNYEEAEACYRQALGFQEDFAEAHNNLGNALRAQKKSEPALDCYKRALELKPNYSEAYNNMGGALRDLKKPEEALDAYNKAIALRQNYQEAYNNMALVLVDLKRQDDALNILSRAVAINPDKEESLILMATMLLDQGKAQGAHSAIQRALKIKPESVGALNLMGRILRDVEDLNGSVEQCRKAIKLNPDFAEAHNNLGISLMELGKFDEATAEFKKALELNPEAIRVYTNLAATKKFTKDDPDLAALEGIMAKPDALSEDDQISFSYALGKAYDDVKEHVKAFDYFLKGATLKRTKLTYDEPAMARLFDRIRGVFTPKLMDEKRGMGNDSNLPIFVIGMPRSGSTLTEQILASHPKVFGAGELKTFHKSVQELGKIFSETVRYPEVLPLMREDQFKDLAKHYLESMPKVPKGTLRISDKMLTNYYYIGLINLVFPNAKIINTRRNPVDTCISCFSKLFREDLPFTYEMGEIGRYYRRYHVLMEHWKKIVPAGTILEVNYEDVVGDIEGQARRLLDFCGLEWDARCLSFYKDERPVKTASVAQVRQPIYKTSVERWRNYGPGVEPLLGELKGLFPA